MVIIAIIGEAGCGKDFLVKELIHYYPFNFHEIISCTTRPQREKEQNGVDYYFLSENEFLDNIKENKMLEYTSFRGWYYGTLLDTLDTKKINIGVFNPAGIYNLLKHSEIQLIVYRLKVTDKERLLRQLNRETNPDVEEIIRRYNTDKNDFSNLTFDYIPLVNNNFKEFTQNLSIITRRALDELDIVG